MREQQELFDPEIYKKDVEKFCDNLECYIDQKIKERFSKLKTVSVPIEELRSLITYVRAATLVYNKRKRKTK